MPAIAKVTVLEQNSLHFAVLATNKDGNGFGGLARREDIIEIVIEALRFAGYGTESVEVELEGPDWVIHEVKIKGYECRLRNAV